MVKLPPIFVQVQACVTNNNRKKSVEMPNAISPRENIGQRNTMSVKRARCCTGKYLPANVGAMQISSPTQQICVYHNEFLRLRCNKEVVRAVDRYITT